MGWRTRNVVGAVLGFALLLVAVPAQAEESFPIDLNAATLDQLDELPGIGRKRAQAIVDRRDRARFTRVSQLLEIRGIGAKTLSRLRRLVFIDAPNGIRAKRPHPLATPLVERDAEVAAQLNPDP